MQLSGPLTFLTHDAIGKKSWNSQKLFVIAGTRLFVV